MTRPFLPLALLLAALALPSLGCATSTVANEAEEPAPTATATVELPATDGPEPPAEAPAVPAGEDATEGKKAMPVTGPGGAKTAKGDGESCDAADECSSGVCEGEGCGAGQGKCMAKNRMCTRDLRPYCGCDGKTFQSSGSCPGARYSAKGACEGDKAVRAVPKP